MNKTRIIKEILGKTLEKKGFKYIGKEKGIIWTFVRNVNDVKEEVYIQQHSIFESEYKLIMWSSAKGNSVKEIGNVLPEYSDNEYWCAETEKEFIEVISFFDKFIKEFGFELLDEMLTEKTDSFETPERKLYFKAHHKELVKKYDAIYHILDNGSREEQLKHIDEVLWENREAEDTPEKNEEIYDLWLGMASILTEIIIREEGGEVSYDTWKVEINRPQRVLKVWPIDAVVQAWLRYHNNERKVDFVWAMCR
ncbi:hypothetical protein SAMN05216351_108110 [Pseudobutyrivibrio sp. JW11]|uniref:hypothetical protein n=1 Tax=Pseudobutyrivibrio sp. JW11 TaxID=1855302 RepID=UPI0008E349F0|nr:hypothetical protein [Pseudobutyrivibrio sp. JW11]SFO40013.1 hypothetical protein SAMN05216351_108110 [Pseudobutyrivibrio sp. JW11]